MNPLQSQAFALKQAGLARARANTLPSSGSFVNGSGAMAALSQIGSLISILGRSPDNDEDALLQGDTQSVASAAIQRSKRKENFQSERIIKSVLSVISMIAML